MPQMLVYESAVPVNLERHRRWSLDFNGSYGFARKLPSVPLMAVEFPQAAADLAIVFSGSGDGILPAAITGVRADENLLVGADGSWRGRYVPAFLRRYPFVFSTHDEGKTFTLCIDEQFGGWNEEGRGERLYTDDDKPTAYVGNVMQFLQQFEAEFARTRAFCRKLDELKLLEPMQAQVELTGGERRTLVGFSAVDRNKRKALPPETLAELAKTDQLELVYLHLQSMNNLALMREHAAKKPASVAA